MNKNDLCYTLITGASSGIGKAMAEEFALRNRNLLLIALPDTGLESQCQNLHTTYQVRSRFFEIDLRETNAPEMIQNFVRIENLKINMLVNNIGIGHEGNIGDLTPDSIDDMIMLNIRAATHLTNLFLKELKSHPKSYILNMGSFGAFVPTPFKSIYMASKAYIYYFSCGLDLELGNSSVKVSVAMPGPVTSNQKMIERILKDGALSRMLALNPNEVAKYIIPRLLLGEKIIIPGRLTRSAYLLGLILPYGMVLYFMKKIFLVKKKPDSFNQA